MENYVRHRPGYPPAVIELLKTSVRSLDAVIADVASGTGIFTRILLENGNRVFGVEPNAEMPRRAKSS
jgi:SAM-dependent methyltransferase